MHTSNNRLTALLVASAAIVIMTASAHADLPVLRTSSIRFNSGCTSCGSPTQAAACNSCASQPVAVAAQPAFVAQPIAVAAQSTYVPLFRRRWTWPTSLTPSGLGFAPASACGTCAPQVACQPVCQKVCRYVPQTSYRTTYCRQPVTVCRAVQMRDPCTGCPKTVMQRTTAYRVVARRTPYTTYRPVYTTVCSKPACSPCATGACASGTCSTGSCASGACGTGIAASGNIPAQNFKIEAKKPTPAPAKAKTNDVHEMKEVPAAKPNRSIPKASPASLPRLNNPRDQVTQKHPPVVKVAHHEPIAPQRADDSGWEAAR
jgi:hypothetical protein